MANRNVDPKAAKYSDLDKAAVRTMIGSGMGIKEVSKRSGISRNTVRDWVRKDPDSNVEYMSDVLTAGTLQELKQLSSLCIRELMNRLPNKELATTKDVLAAMEITLNAQIALVASIKPKAPQEENESEFWRGVVSRLLMKAQQAGEKITYEQAVQKVITIKPESQPFLMAENAPNVEAAN